MIYKFKKTYEFDGKKYESLEIPLEGLTGKDMRKVNRKFTSAGLYAATPELDYDYCIIVVQRVCPNLPQEFFDDMPLIDFNGMMRDVGRFLLNAESEATA